MMHLCPFELSEVQQVWRLLFNTIACTLKKKTIRLTKKTFGSNFFQGLSNTYYTLQQGKCALIMPSEILH